MAWNDGANPGQCTLPVVSHSWLGLIGKLYDERFPFWFYDTCVEETYTFVFGKRVYIPPDLTLISQKGKTRSLRELGFWWDFYVATRTERLALAASIRQQLGSKLSDGALAAVLEAWGRRDEIGRATAQRIELELSAEGSKQPSPQYLAARAYAQNYMDTLEAA